MESRLIALEILLARALVRDAFMTDDASAFMLDERARTMADLARLPRSEREAVENHVSEFFATIATNWPLSS